MWSICRPEVENILYLLGLTVGISLSVHPGVETEPFSKMLCWNFCIIKHWTYKAWMLLYVIYRYQSITELYHINPVQYLMHYF